VILAGHDGDDVILTDGDDSSPSMPTAPALPVLTLRFCCCCCGPPGDDVILTGRGGDDITLAGLSDDSSSDVSYMGFHIAGMALSAKAGPPVTQTQGSHPCRSNGHSHYTCSMQQNHESHASEITENACRLIVLVVLLDYPTQHI
jgi:hypothetical protein